EHRAEIDARRAANERYEPGGEPLPEGILAGERDAEPRVGEHRERRDYGGDADEPELLADHRQDHVCMRLGQVVDLPDALSEPDAEHATRTEADHRLHGLEAGPLRVLPRVE